MATDLVPPFADDAFRRVLCVVAHPDDVEYGISSAVAAWTARGVDVAYLLLTRGEAGMDSSPPERTAQLRTEEQIAGSRAVGVSEVEFLDHRDGVLEYGLDLRRDIARVIRRRQPDAVVVGSWEVEFAAGLNQADHRVAGLAALDALRDAGNRWVFPELLDEGLQPHSARWLLVGGDPRPTHGVDVTGEPLERGIASLEAHEQYLAGLPGHPAPADDDHRLHRVAGTVHGRAARGAVPGLGLPVTPADRGRDHGGDAGRLRGDARQCRQLSAQLVVSACRPGPELVGVAYGPDVLDPVACDVEREHRHGDAVLLGHQAGLAVDRAFQERQVAGCPAGDIDPGSARSARRLRSGAGRR